MKNKRVSFRLDEAHEVITQALANTYAQSRWYYKESDFQFELYHQLHSMKLNGTRLGERKTGTSTCMLHFEARAENGNGSTADLLICDPTSKMPLNYRPEVAIELKLELNRTKLEEEFEKFSRYRKGLIRRLYVIDDRAYSINEWNENAVRAKYRDIETRVHLLNRSPKLPAPTLQGREPRNRPWLKKQVAACIKSTLRLYGEGSHQYNGFFWRNDESRLGTSRPLPALEDFYAQLYHRLRCRLPKTARVRTNYRSASSLVDFEALTSWSSVGIEIKRSWDEFSLVQVKEVVDKFRRIRKGKRRHTNFLVVIQGECGFTSEKNKRNATRDLRKARTPFILLSYDEWRQRPDETIFLGRSRPSANRN